MISHAQSVVYLCSNIDPHHAWLCRNEIEIRKWCRQYHLISPQMQDAWVDKINSDSSIYMLSVRDHNHSQVGVCGLTSIDRQNQSAEFSLWLDSSRKKANHGRHALWLLLRHGFFDLNLHRIWGEVFEGNPAMDLFQKIGFRTVGTLRDSYFRNGSFINSFLIDMLTDELPSGSQWMQAP